MIAQIFIPTAEPVIPTGTPTTEAMQKLKLKSY